MQNRQSGLSQEASAAKADISVRSARRIEKNERAGADGPRTWRTRTDPLTEVWDSELKPLLERDSTLTGLTLLEYLQDHYPDKYDVTVLRTLQRRVKQWKALNGPAQPVIFRQQLEPGWMALSDFTHPDEPVTVAGEPFAHLFYQFRLAFSGWRSVTIVQGGESYAALAEGLQRALRQAGGAPKQHRTDSLSAAFNNQQNRWSDAYGSFCAHYGMAPSRNNPGVAHENGAIECANGSFKRRLSQALKLRGSARFDSVADYQRFVDTVVERLNRRVASRFKEEQPTLQALPSQGFAAYSELAVRVTRTSTIEVRHVLYTVPSQLIGERLRVHLYHDRLKCYLGSSLAITLPRVYPASGQSRARRVDYRHVIHALAAKPQAFRRAHLRDDLLPSDTYRALWQLVDATLPEREACKWMVTVLRLAYDYDCEGILGSELLYAATVEQHALSEYDGLLTHNRPSTASTAEVTHG